VTGATVVEPAGPGPRPGHPYPDDAELQALESRIEGVANGMYNGRVLAVNTGMLVLHAERKARKTAWDKPLELPAPAVRADRIPGDAIAVDLHRLAAQPFDSALAQALGWTFLREHQNREARRLVL
jgi:acetamidase/formamidase